MTHRHVQVPIRVFQPGRRGKKRREVTPRGPRRVSTEAGAGLRHAPEAGRGPPACRRLTEEKADVAGGAARPGGKSVSPKCARQLPPASFGGLPPRGGRPAPPRGSEEDPGSGPCCTGEGAANEPSATQHDEGHNPGTPRDSERAKPSQIRATPQPPRSGATATAGEKAGQRRRPWPRAPGAAAAGLRAGATSDVRAETRLRCLFVPAEVRTE